MEKSETLDDLLSAALGEATLSDEAAWHYLKRVESQHDEANKTLVRRVFAVVIAWAVLSGVASGFVTGGQIGNFQLAELSSLLGFGPLIIALIQYGIFSSLIAMWVIEMAVHKCYERLAPELKKRNLQYLANTPTFWNIEEFIDRASSKGLLGSFHAVFQFVLYFGVTFGSFSIIVHVAYLAYAVGTWWWPFTTCSVAVSFIFWMRGLLALFTVSRW